MFVVSPLFYGHRHVPWLCPYRKTTVWVTSQRPPTWLSTPATPLLETTRPLSKAPLSAHFKIREDVCCPSLARHFFFFIILFYAAGFEAFPGVSSQLSGSWLNAPQKRRLMCGLKSWKNLDGEEQEESERGGRLTCSLSTGKVIYDSWRDGTGCQVCVNFLLLLFFQLWPSERKSRGSG